MTVGAALLSALLGGCGGKDQPAASPQPDATKPAISDLSKAISTNPAAPPGTPAVPGSVAPGPAAPTRGVVLNDDGVEIGLAQINAALRVFVRDIERFPNSFEEMVKSGVISHIPAPPAGKKYTLDPNAKTAVMIDK